ncbi:MAG: ornithine acetyltransferase [Candidatus Aeolococcus gillhamiae]|uniref:Arginine biosynthesis bifunctional protein ArgJ n=1 Tax=Candidatus Aeolococcus gillhamiae TaxID=3127015 RepID=A0A2W5Z2T2_9BACT|nr:MAG: ornithine acetyltransferase [Candidatus Dormibacter sp. RRmetagenome_bin12]
MQWPTGFAAFVGSAALRDDGHDVAVVSMDRQGTSAGVFTQSLFSGPSVVISRERLAATSPRALVVVAKNANVANGAQGHADAVEVARLAAGAAGVAAEEMLIASTGVIGRPYPMPALRACLAGSTTEPWSATPLEVARAIMTTDTVPKTAQRRVGAASVVGVAKGVGMIEPEMATLLAFAFTDAAVARPALERMWRRAVDASFNCLSIDTDTSTSDAAVVLASGAAGAVDEAILASALREVCLDLTLQLARDGEGATKLLAVTVRDARDEDQARRVAKSIVNSPLVKTAVHGADPNWGRVAMAVGKCHEESDIDPERVVIRFGDLEAYPARPGPEGLAELARAMAADHVEIDVQLCTGAAEATVYGCDLSADYVRINADYTT